MRTINPRLPLVALAFSLILTGCDRNGTPLDPPPIGGGSIGLPLTSRSSGRR